MQMLEREKSPSGVDEEEILGMDVLTRTGFLSQ